MPIYRITHHSPSGSSKTSYSTIFTINAKGTSFRIRLLGIPFTMCYRRLTKYDCGHEVFLPHYCGKSLNPATGERTRCKTIIQQPGIDHLPADKCVFKICMLNQVPYGGYWNCCQYAHGAVNSAGFCTQTIRRTIGEGSDSWVADVNCGHFICTRCTVYGKCGQHDASFLSRF